MVLVFLVFLVWRALQLPAASGDHTKPDKMEQHNIYIYMFLPLLSNDRKDMWLLDLETTPDHKDKYKD